MRSEVQARWRVVDALGESLRGGNEAMVRALDVFEGARNGFNKAVGAAVGGGAGYGSVPAALSDTFLGQQQQQQQQGGGGVAPFSSGGVNADSDGARGAYFRAEECLGLLREQLARSEGALKQMAEEVEGARLCIASCYDTDEIESRQERKEARARASLQALDRGDYGCLMSAVEMVRAMAGLLRMHQSEFEMQETVVYGVGYTTPVEILTAYREALKLRPFMNDRFLSQVQEIRELSEELEHHARSGNTGQSSAGK